MRSLIFLSLSLLTATSAFAYEAAPVQTADSSYPQVKTSASATPQPTAIPVNTYVPESSSPSTMSLEN